MLPSEFENPNNLPLPWRGGSDSDLQFFQHDWDSGSRVHLPLPKDFSWPSNPKENQEENGSGEVEQPISR